MRATPGSQITIKGHHLGEPGRSGEVLEARGPGSTEPFLVRWDDSGHTSLLFPGNDCVVRQLHPARTATAADDPGERNGEVVAR